MDGENCSVDCGYGGGSVGFDWGGCGASSVVFEDGYRGYEVVRWLGCGDMVVVFSLFWSGVWLVFGFHAGKDMDNCF